MIGYVQQHRLEAKYLLLTVLILGCFFALSKWDAVSNLETQLTDNMDQIATWGYVGLFLTAYASNVSVLFIIHVGLPLYALAMYAHNLEETLWLGTAVGLGCALGELTSYVLARTLVTHLKDLEHNSLFRWARAAITRWPAAVPLLVIFFAATPAPDMVILIPLALSGYAWHKLIFPLVLAKVVQNVAMALLYRYFTEQMMGIADGAATLNLTAALSVLFVLLVAYQIEKSRVLHAVEVASIPQAVQHALKKSLENAA